jgi:hypothetical protein
VSPRRAPGAGRRRDANEDLIVESLEAVRATVERLHPAGRGGLPDLLVGFRGQTYLIEVKTLDGELDDGQLDWHLAWRGAPVIVARTPEQALRAIGALYEGG